MALERPTVIRKILQTGPRMRKDSRKPSGIELLIIAPFENMVDFPTFTRIIIFVMSGILKIACLPLQNSSYIVPYRKPLLI